MNHIKDDGMSIGIREVGALLLRYSPAYIMFEADK